MHPYSSYNTSYSSSSRRPSGDSSHASTSRSTLHPPPHSPLRGRNAAFPSTSPPSRLRDWRTRDSDAAPAARRRPFPGHDSTWRSGRSYGPHHHPPTSSSRPEPHTTSPFKAGQGLRSGTESTRRGHDHTQPRKDSSQVDWTEVETVARQKGFLVPTDIVDEFKRQGHYDQLRRQVLANLQASPQKDDLLQSISSLLLSHFQAVPREAARLGRLEDARLRESDCLKIIDMEELPRTPFEDERRVPLSGPEKLQQLMRTLRGETNVPLEEGVGTTADQNVSGILNSQGRLGKGVRQRVESLVRDEIKEGKKIVAAQSSAPATVQAYAGTEEKSKDEENGITEGEKAEVENIQNDNAEEEKEAEDTPQGKGQTTLSHVGTEVSRPEDDDDEEVPMEMD